MDTASLLAALPARISAIVRERAARLDWDALFHACPPLLRQWRGSASSSWAPSQIGMAAPAIVIGARPAASRSAE